VATLNSEAQGAEKLAEKIYILSEEKILHSLENF
jgi:hypothetical protein